MAHSKVIIIDYGSQVTQLIARRVREAGVYSEIHACNVTAAEVAAMAPSAIILSGGPASVGEADAPTLDKGFLELGVPGAGHLLRHAAAARNLGGELAQSLTREYGPADPDPESLLRPVGRPGQLQGQPRVDEPWRQGQDSPARLRDHRQHPHPRSGCHGR